MLIVNLKVTTRKITKNIHEKERRESKLYTKTKQKSQLKSSKGGVEEQKTCKIHRR